MEKKQFFAEVKEVKGNTFSAYASTRSLDRDREVILPEAVSNLIEYMKNPVLLQMHDYRKPPAGKVLKIDRDSKGIPFEGEFAPTPEGEMFKSLYEGNFMNAFSVGFIPKSWTDIDPDNEEEIYRLNTPNGVVEFNLNDYKKEGKVRRVYTDIELLEISVVPVPANPDALQRMEQMSAKLAEFVKGMKDADGDDDSGDGTDDKKASKDGGTDDVPGDVIEVGDVVQDENEHALWMIEELEGFKTFRRERDAEIVDKKTVDRITGYDEEGNAKTLCLLYDADVWSEEDATKDANDRDKEGQVGNFYAAKSTIGTQDNKDGDDDPGKKRVIPYKRYPIIDRSWDAGAARKRLLSWAGGPDPESVDFSKFRLGFGWYDESKADNLTSYKFPHHDVVDGSLKTNIRGVIAAMSVVNGGRGGASLSDADRKKLYTHLAKHYRDADMEPPDLKEFDDPELDPAFDMILDLKKEVDAIVYGIVEIKEKISPTKSGGSDDDLDDDAKGTLDLLSKLSEGLKEVLPQ